MKRLKEVFYKMVLVYDNTGKYGHARNYLLLSKSKPHRVLYIFGGNKPKPSEILKQERRIQFFKSGKTLVHSHKRSRPRRSR